MRNGWFLARACLFAAVLCVAGAAPAHAQLGALLSPGPLAKAHASLEGASNCQKCHERGNRVTAAKCLTCHQPIAQRIARKTGVHRNVTNDCVSCHADHAGVDGELRPFDQSGFDHAGEAGFALVGKHAPVAGRCAACHKTRSFLTAKSACAACHEDKHKGALGTACERCHAVEVTFASATRSFDHGRTAFALTGAHRTATCVSCHKTPTYKIEKFEACTSCHVTPHAPRISSVCASCHTTETWRTKTFDHARTAFPLVGKHVTTDCAGCHKAPAAKVKPAAGTCATCHADPHKGTFGRKDCRSCHTEAGWKGATFDHLTATGYGLTDKHATVSCRACHTTLSAPGTPTARASLDYRGLKTACASCHADPHRAELGPACERCHTAKTFKVAAFTHAKALDLFGGQHARVACNGCHIPKAGSASAGTTAAARVAAVSPPSFTATPTACASCHTDPHLGQFTTACETCHSVAGEKFRADRFTHDRTAYPLTGRHQPVACAACHKPATLASPAGAGRAARYRGLDKNCVTCHADTHLGQIKAACERCHTPSTFKVMAYTHLTPRRDFFAGRHLTADCKACHATVTRQFPAGRGTAINFSVGTTCTACHTDPHQGSLGTDCARCHRPAPSAPSASPTPSAPTRPHA